MSGAQSPGSRTRLVVASQALEIQHLQDLLRSKEKESSDLARTLSGEREQAKATIDTLAAKNSRLENQVQLLAEKLRSLENAQESRMGSEVGVMASMAQSGKERDSLISQLRDELRTARSQYSSALQEREILLEKLVAERTRATNLETKIQEMASPVYVAKEKSTNSTQTDEFGIVDLFNDANDNPNVIEELRNHIELEQVLVTHHQDMTAKHAAQAAELHEKLQQLLQRQVRRLQQEQEKYSKMMSSYGGLRVNNLSAAAAVQIQPLQSPAAVGSNTPPPPPPSPPVAATPAAIPLFETQAREMANLKERLQVLQRDHEQLRGGPLPENPRSSHHYHLSQSPAIRKPSGAASPSVSTGADQGILSGGGDSAILHRLLQSATKGRY